MITDARKSKEIELNSPTIGKSDLCGEIYEVRLVQIKQDTLFLQNYKGKEKIGDETQNVWCEKRNAVRAYFGYKRRNKVEGEGGIGDLV